LGEGRVRADELTVRRILGDQPFAEIGRPVWAVTDQRHGCVIAAGDLGHGEVEILDTATGQVRARHTLRAHGHPATPVSAAYRADQQRLVVGTVDGRILDCSVRD